MLSPLRAALLRSQSISRSTLVPSRRLHQQQRHQQAYTFRRRAMATTTTATPDDPAASAPPPPGGFRFGPWPIGADEVFYRTELSFAFVNLKPLVPGHVLVSPIAPRARFADLTPEEVADMWRAAQRVGSALEKHHRASALTLAIQDGAAAGQTVPHVHVHVLPRAAGDFERNDEVYPALEAQEKGMDGMHKEKESPQRLDLDVERKPRTREEMAQEAAVYRRLFLDA